jgi:phosphate transport system substrate-binding protein
MRSRILKWLITVITAAVSATAWSGENQLVITGSSTIAPLVLEMSKRYEKQNPGIRIDVQTGGSSRGINDVRMGLTDIGMVSRALSPNETDLKGHLTAIDGITIILNQANPITNLSRQQVIDIYQGKITHWKMVGGPDIPISVVNKAEGRSTLELFLAHFELKNSQIKASVVIGDNQQGIKVVAGNPGAIGYVSVGTAEYEVTRGTPIKLVALGANRASTAAVATGQYPLTRELNLITSGEIPRLAADFIRFAQSKQVHDLIEKQFFVSP